MFLMFLYEHVPKLRVVVGTLMFVYRKKVSGLGVPVSGTRCQESQCQESRFSRFET